MEISVVVAMASNRAIGKDNTLLWHISEDLKYFKALTMGAPIVMGRKTYESIGRPLPGRRNVVLSRNSELEIAGCECYTSLDSALAALASEEKVFVIGGGQIYEQALDVATKLYVTEVSGEYDADTYFPAIGSQWQEHSRQDYAKGEKFDGSFSFVSYIKK